MSAWAASWAWRVTVEAEARLVLLALADQADDEDRVLVSESLLVELTCLPAAVVRECVSELAAERLLVGGKWCETPNGVALFLCRLPVPAMLSRRKVS